MALSVNSVASLLETRHTSAGHGITYVAYGVLRCPVVVCIASNQDGVMQPTFKEASKTYLMFS